MVAGILTAASLAISGAGWPLQAGAQVGGSDRDDLTTLQRGGPPDFDSCIEAILDRPAVPWVLVSSSGVAGFLANRPADTGARLDRASERMIEIIAERIRRGRALSGGGLVSGGGAAVGVAGDFDGEGDDAVAPPGPASAGIVGDFDGEGTDDIGRPDLASDGLVGDVDGDGDVDGVDYLAWQRGLGTGSPSASGSELGDFGPTVDDVSTTYSSFGSYLAQPSPAIVDTMAFATCP